MPDNYHQKAYIKNIYISLPNYEFNHHPLDGSEKNSKYTGRERLESDFLDLLKKSGQRGAYLVSGFRGMGKTSFVKNIIRKFQKDKKENDKANIIESINLSFAQKDIKEEDILKQLLAELVNKYEGYRTIQLSKKFTFFNILSLIGSIIYLLIFIKYGAQLNAERIFTIPFAIGTVLGLVFITRTLISIYNSLIKSITTRRFSRVIVRSRRWSRHWSTKVLFLLVVLLTIISLIFQLNAVYILLYISIVAFMCRVVIILFKESIQEASQIANWIQLYTDVRIYSRLKHLELKCNAQIVEEDGYDGDYSKELPFLFQRKSKSFPISSVKQVENELIRIFREIKKGNDKSKYKRSFIVVFDELDKVEPTLENQIQTHDFQVLNSDNNQINKSRDRKMTILNLLSSLKYFVCEAEAKFIFIAGREMFDAALADIADRQSFISSIFHKVIYVDSFLKDDSQFSSSGLAATFEEYLRKILMNDDRERTFEGENFLREYLTFLNTPQVIDKVTTLTPLSNEKARLKVIYTLQNFLIYLTYRSNGSPKKMSKLIEDHVVTESMSKIRQSSFKNIVVESAIKDETEKTLWLKFTYHDQYRFGFISHLFRPYIFTFSEYAKRLSDNVLVSMPYLMDHILKFHHFAFSIQNLELLPEVISSTKNPTIRSFIAEIIDYLRLNHIANTEIGLFDFRFLKKTSNEITYISKIFEAESAAFNFSLDEMYAIKQYLIGRIQFLKGKNSNLSTSPTDSYYSLSLLESLLGDSYYFDQEYDSAIVVYLDSLQSLKDSKAHQRGYEHFISSLRLTLKLGLMYELIKKYDLALSYFNDAIAMYSSVEQRAFKNGKISQVETLFYQANLAALTLIEKGSIKGLTKDTLDLYVNRVSVALKESSSNTLLLADFYNDLGNIQFFNNCIHRSIHKKGSIILDRQSYTEDLIKNEDIGFFVLNDDSKDFRVSTQVPIYFRKALIYVLYRDDKRRSFAEVFKEASNRITDYSNEYHTSELSVIGYNLSSIGNYFLSFYAKNESKTKVNVDQLIKWAKEWRECNEWIKQLNIEINEFSDKEGFESANLNNLINWRKGSLFNVTIKNKIKNKETHEVNFEFVKSHFKELKIRPMKFWDIVTKDYFSQKCKSNESNEINVAELVFALFYISGRYYSKSGVTKTFGYQLKKILQTFLHLRNEIELTSSLSPNRSEEDNYLEISTFFEETILSMILEAASWNSDSTDRGQIYKYKYYQKTEDDYHGNRVYHPKDKMAENYLNASNSPDVKEGVILLSMIKLEHQTLKTLKADSNAEEILKFYQNIPSLSLVNEFNTLKTQYARLMELSLLTRINKKILGQILSAIDCEDWLISGYRYYKKNDRSKLENYKCEPKSAIFNFLCEVVASSIFSLTQIIKIFKIYEVDPDLNNCQLAFHHKSLGVWLQVHALCIYLESESSQEEEGGGGANSDFIIDRKMNELFDSSNRIASFVATTQFQKALQYLHKAKGFHSAGLAFQSELNEIIYLEADYEDHYYQFGIALERQKMNSGKIRSLIRDLEKEIVDSPLYRYDSFVVDTMVESENEIQGESEPIK